MADSFDPYYKWLGIPPAEQPPNHYRLLGVSLFESHAEVISNAADRQMLLLRTFQSGKSSALSQKLLNEVAAARVCLLSPEKKTAYDERLRKELAAKVKPTAGGSSKAGAVRPATSAAKRSVGSTSKQAESSAKPGPFPNLKVESSTRHRTRQSAEHSGARPTWTPILIVGGGVVGLAICAAVLFLLFSGGQSEPSALKLKDISPVTVTEGELVTFDVHIEDPASWQQQVRYQLVADAPPTASIDPQTGKFTWRPDKSGKYPITVRVVGDDSKAKDERAFLVTVKQKAKPPVLAAISDQTLKLSDPLRLPIKVADAGSPSFKLQFSLKPGAPAGMQIDRDSGIITWRPAEDVSPGDYPVVVRIQAANHDELADEKSLVIHLAKMDNPKPPVLAAIADQIVKSGERLTLPVQIDDPGTDADHLRFRLDSGAPAGMTIDPQRGIITWQPSEETVAGEHVVKVRVESAQSSNLADEKTFRVRIAAPDVGPKAPMGGTAKKIAAPDESTQTRELVELKKEFEKEYTSRQAHVRLALAARMILQSREANQQPVKCYVLLQQARSLATEQGDSLLPRLAVDQLAVRFDVDAMAMRIEDFCEAARRVRAPVDIDMIVETAVSLAKEAVATETYDSLLLSMRRVEKITAKASNTRLNKAVQTSRKRLQAMRDLCRQSESATTASEKTADDGDAKLAQGKFLCLAHGDWAQGLAMLAKGSDQQLRTPATSLVSNAGDVAAQLSMADAWWTLAQKQRPETGYRFLLETAARYWYERALPRLAGKDLAHVQTRLQPGVRRAKRPFLLSLHGLGGLSALVPKKVSGKVLPAGQFAMYQGKGTLAYEQIPVSSYIHDFELTLPQPQGTFSLTYGDSHIGARIVFRWIPDKRKFRCRLFTYRGGVVFWSGERHFDPQQVVHFTLYVNENHQWLYQNGNRILGTGARPTDLRFSISSDAQTTAVLSRCEFRPWTQADATLANCTIPPTTINTDWVEAGLHLFERNLELSDHPVLTDNRPFLAGTTRTSMQWLPAGSFKRKRPPNKKNPAAAENAGTEVTLTHGYWIGQYEVSQGEWSAVMPAPASAFRVVGSPFLPVDGARYEDAVKFCQLLTQLEKRARRLPPGYQYRLPTEAEWEYACHAGSTGDFSVEDTGFWSAETSKGRPHLVGRGKPNAWNLYDMHGNVDEWCLDAWQDEPKTPVFRLTDPVVLPQSSTGFFVLRGGAWWKGRKGCTSSGREKSKSVAGGYRGFRVVLGPVLR